MQNHSEFTSQNFRYTANNGLCAKNKDQTSFFPCLDIYCSTAVSYTHLAKELYDNDLIPFRKSAVKHALNSIDFCINFNLLIKMAELLGYSESNMGYSLKEYKRMIVVYYHDDLDGQCSAAQVRESMEDITANPIRCIAVQYLSLIHI